MAYKKDRDVREAHPGWAVRFEDGTWLGGAHGWFRSEDAFYADICDTKEECEKYLKYVREDTMYKGEFDLPAEVVEAWQPICESLRLEVNSLKVYNTVKFGDIFDLKMQLEDALNTVNEWEARSKEIPDEEDE